MISGIISLLKKTPKQNFCSIRDLYPEIEPYNQFKLKVSETHTIHIEECGNPNGKPLIYLHGGPGSGISPSVRRYFNPKLWRVILFD